MREQFPYEHEVWANEGPEDLPPYARPSSPVSGSAPSQAWENSVKISGAIWSLMFAAQELSRMIEQGFKPFGTSAQEDIALTIKKLQKIEASFRDNPL